MIIFPFGTNGKSIILGVPILKYTTVQCNHSCLTVFREVPAVERSNVNYFQFVKCKTGYYMEVAVIYSLLYKEYLQFITSLHKGGNPRLKTPNFHRWCHLHVIIIMLL